MPDFSVRSDSVNVEQIMEQIRARIREKRGVDYTEQQIHDLAKVKLEKFLDPRGLRSDLLDQFRKQPYRPPNVPTLVFEDTTMFETHRGFLRFMRKLLAPVLKLFFNPNALIHALHTQAEINKAALERERLRRDTDALYFEVIHNLVLELTRTGIEMKNVKMRVESLASRVEFNERRARALESAVMYKTPGEPAAGGDRAPRERAPQHVQPAPPPVGAPSPQPSSQPPSSPQGAAPMGEGPGQRSRRRRRRRGRRSGAPAAAMMSGGGNPASASPPQTPDAIPAAHAVSEVSDVSDTSDTRTTATEPPDSDSEPQ